MVVLSGARLPAGGPDWLGSPQHVVAGAVLAFVLVFAASRLSLPLWLAATLAIALTSTAELLLEIVEYAVAHPRFVTAYYDTIADMTSSFVGAVVGAGAAAWISVTRRQA